MSNVFEKYFFRAGDPGTDPAKTEMVCSDNHDLMGFYYHSAWYRDACTICAEEYALAYDELFAFVGQDMEHPADLGGELSFTVAGREYVTDKSCMVLVPKGVPRGPIRLNRVDRPLFAYVGGASREKVGIPKEQWRVPETVEFRDYFLHFNGIDHDESEFEVFRLHGQDNQMVDGFGGVFYGKFRWFKVTTPEDYVFALESHSHSLPEMLHFYGTDPDHPEDLGAEVTMDMMDEKYRFDQSTTLFVPSNQPHCPMTINKVTRPFMFFTLMPDCKVYTLD